MGKLWGSKAKMWKPKGINIIKMQMVPKTIWPSARIQTWTNTDRRNHFLELGHYNLRRVFHIKELSRSERIKKKKIFEDLVPQHSRETYCWLSMENHKETYTTHSADCSLGKSSLGWTHTRSQWHKHSVLSVSLLRLCPASVLRSMAGSQSSLHT